VGGALIMVGIALVRIDEMRPDGMALDAAFSESAETAVEQVPLGSRAR
jgi:hypothetical protein